MAKLMCQTLIRTATTSSSTSSPFFSAVKPGAIRLLSTQAESTSSAELALPEAEAKVVERIEDAIHSIIAKRSKPDWLPFVPGASYWVPPRRSSYGVAEIVNKLTNALTDEEFLALTTLRGWPSSDFFINSDVSSLDLAEGVTLSTRTTVQEEEG